MRDEFIIERQGKKFALYAGLLDAAHERGLKRITTSVVQLPNKDNDNTAIFHAEVELGDGCLFSGFGDASPATVGRNIAPHFIRMAECVPLDTKILTRRGWVYHDELQVGEDVLGYDLLSDTCKWVPCLEVTRHDPQPILCLSNKTFRFHFTHGHSFAVVNNNKRSLRKSNDFKAADRIILAAKVEGGNSPLTPREAAILGWLATDGTVSRRQGKKIVYTRAVIRQSKPEQVAVIRQLMGEDGVERVSEPRQRDFGRYVSDCLPSHDFDLTAGFARQLLEKAGWSAWSDMPNIVLALSEEARMAMLDAMLRGDGTRKPSTKQGYRWSFGKKRKPGVMAAFEILATLEGVALGKPTFSSVGDVPCRSLLVAKRLSPSYCKLSTLDPEPVWCPTTSLGTWVAMDRSGSISITGNTRSKARALRDALNINAVAVEELGDLDEPREAPTQGPARFSTGPPTTFGGPPTREPGPFSRSPSPVLPLITDSQRRFINSLGAEKGFEPEELDTWLMASFGEAISNLRVNQASKAIETLKEMPAKGEGTVASGLS